MKFALNDFKSEARQPRVIIILFSVVVLSISFLIAYLIHASSISKVIANTNANHELNSAKLYAQVINAQFSDKVQTEKNIQFINESDASLENVFVVNKFAGIIFPVSMAYDIIRDPKFDEILNLGSEAVVVHDKQNNKIFSPLFAADKSIKGVVIIQFSANADRGVKSKLGMYLFLYLLLLGLVFFAARKLTALLQSPWSELADNVEDALNGEGFDAPHQSDTSLLSKHHFLYFRILSKLTIVTDSSQDNQE